LAISISKNIYLNSFGHSIILIIYPLGSLLLCWLKNVVLITADAYSGCNIGFGSPPSPEKKFTLGVMNIIRGGVAEHET